MSKKKNTKVMIAARVDVSVDKAIERHCKESGVSKQRAIEAPLAQAYIRKGRNFTYTHS